MRPWRSSEIKGVTVADEKRKPTSAGSSIRKKETDPIAAPEEAVGAPRPFDVKTVEFLIRLMREHELTEIDLREGDQRVRLSKGLPAGASYSLPAMSYATPASAGAASSGAPAATTAPAAPVKTLLDIKSELIGTFYAKPKPDKDDYVKVGTRVTADTLVCQIEAMKIFNEIRAGVAGVITDVCVKNGDPVEYNKVLFRVDPS